MGIDRISLLIERFGQRFTAIYGLIVMIPFTLFLIFWLIFFFILNEITVTNIAAGDWHKSPSPLVFISLAAVSLCCHFKFLWSVSKSLRVALALAVKIKQSFYLCLSVSRSILAPMLVLNQKRNFFHFQLFTNWAILKTF